jgi:hypothetical protein
MHFDVDGAVLDVDVLASEPEPAQVRRIGLSDADSTCNSAERRRVEALVAALSS